ncbi:DEAD/DEAH box helicase [Candidatus Peregrinibacteria bacterium]|nr:DEAD/DEAH box helicase [Candidatus Peregrinibacteria bacterium]
MRYKYLHKASSSSEFDLYHAALEWDLIDPIVIEKREDLRSVKKWKDLVDPYHHQVTNLITFCRRLPCTLLADDVGLGKTISAGLIASELISRNRVRKFLVVCPKLLIPQWEEELKEKFDIDAVGATGSELLKATPPNGIGAVVTTYASARIHLDKIGKAGFDMLILDEAHKLRNLYGTPQPPQVAERFKKALEDRLFKYVLMLTATPIQNRLWDIYSLIDLLTVARGHENPFGTDGMFARKFIGDSRTNARRLKPGVKDEFRSIVYGYMSRIRRADANLHFPERNVQLHKVDPTPDELKLIDTISQPIQKLNRLAQISILQALISSPHALSAQLNNMANKGTIPVDLASEVQDIVNQIGPTAKLQGLGKLVEELKAENPEKWRMVVFTTRRETQTTIEAFLGENGIKCGLINGDSGPRNQKTIQHFKKEIPELHVIVSTEAGSEGVNLQAANILVNFDLPWNPMVVEQRIGRIQRLASEHSFVGIFNIILGDTFEEYIVGRLMEKLQLAAHAIGDIEAMLEASGLDNVDDKDNVSGFEEQLRRLVIDSLAGKDIKKATKAAEKSIEEAKLEMAREEKHMNALLGGMEDAPDNAPRCPSLPAIERTLDGKTFAITALAQLGAEVIKKSDKLYACKTNGHEELISFDEKTQAGTNSILYEPGAPPFERLVNKITAKQLHNVNDGDKDPKETAITLARRWAEKFGAKFKDATIKEVWRCFEGTALIRVRVAVAHDSYERLIEVQCEPSIHKLKSDHKWLGLLDELIENPKLIGISESELTEKAMNDPGIAEFTRFYKERLVQEVASAGTDERKRKKLADEFTPRHEMIVVGLKGTVTREIVLAATYELEGNAEYTSEILVAPSKAEIIESSDMCKCELTKLVVPCDCIETCQISNKRVLRHLLIESEESKRFALAEHTLKCSLSGKRILEDEAEKSVISGNLVTKTLLKTSALSGKRGEPEYYGKCEFTSAEVLKTELSESEISGKKYRNDEEMCSAVSNKVGHKSEFIFCAETGKPLLPTEAVACEVTGKLVMPGVLEQCAVSKKHVLPSELEKSSISGKKALKEYFATSSISHTKFLETEGIKSVSGKFCSPEEAIMCNWSQRESHPDDINTCTLTGLEIRKEYLTNQKEPRLKALVELLDGIQRPAEKDTMWHKIEEKIAKVLHVKNPEVETALLGPNKQILAVCISVKTWLGFKIRYAALLYTLKSGNIIGRVMLGKREPTGWQMESMLGIS